MDGGVFGILLEDADGSIDECGAVNVAQDGLVIGIGAAPVVRTSTVTGCGNRACCRATVSARCPAATWSASTWALVKLMEDSRHEIAVIVAGYSREMADFLDANSRLSPDAGPALMAHFARFEGDPNFGNAREARKVFEGMRKVQARRLRRLGVRPSLDDLRTLTEPDVLAAIGS